VGGVVPTPRRAGNPRPSRRCLAHCGRGKSTWKSPTSPQQSACPPWASPRLFPVIRAGRPSRRWASSYRTQGGSGYSLQAQLDPPDRCLASFATRTAYTERHHSLHRVSLPSHLLHRQDYARSIRGPSEFPSCVRLRPSGLILDTLPMRSRSTTKTRRIEIRITEEEYNL
jgi:hypothetical protein